MARFEVYELDPPTWPVSWRWIASKHRRRGMFRYFRYPPTSYNPLPMFGLRSPSPAQETP